MSTKEIENYKGIKKYDHVALWCKRDTVIIKDIIAGSTFLDDENNVIDISQIQKRLHPFPKSKTVHGIKRTLQYGLLSDTTIPNARSSNHKICILFVMQELTDERILEITEPFIKSGCSSFYIFGKQDRVFREHMYKLYPEPHLDIEIGDYWNACGVWKSENETYNEDKMHAWALETQENDAEFALLSLFRYCVFSSHTDLFFIAEDNEILDSVLISLAYNLAYDLKEIDRR